MDLAVLPGELILITGASGCGKSTLALALAGLIPARVQGELRGAVRFGGRPLSGMAPHDAAQHVGLVFQNPSLQLINMTVQSEVAFGPENIALPQPEIAARVDWALDVTAMGRAAPGHGPHLVRRQKQRTAIAATLAMRPRVLVLDEPLSDLDPVGAGGARTAGWRASTAPAWSSSSTGRRSRAMADRIVNARRPDWWTGAARRMGRSSAMGGHGSASPTSCG